MFKDNRHSRHKCSNIKDVVDTNRLITQELLENIVKDTEEISVMNNGARNLTNAKDECKNQVHIGFR